MAYSFNIFTGTFDEVLPISPQTFGSTPNVDGVSADSANNLTLQPADATHPGGVSTTTQSFGGNKTFTGSVSINGATTLTAAQASSALVTDASKNIISSVTTAGELAFVSGVTSAIQTQLDAKEILANKGVANGYAPLDSSAKIPASYLPSTVFIFLGAWDPSTNTTPTLIDGIGTNGYTYRVSTAFPGPVIGLNDPSMVNFQIGNLIIYNGTVWQQNTSADGVTFVNGAQGAVTVNAINQLTGDVTATAATQSQSKATAIAAIQGTVVTGTTGSGNVVFDTSPTINSPSVSGNSVFTNNISAPGMFTPFGPAISLSGGYLTDSNGVEKIDWVNGNLTDTSNNTQLHFDTSGVAFNQLTASTVPYLNASKVLTSSAVTPTQLSFVDATSSIQTQLNSKVTAVSGDIQPSSFAASNNVASPTNVTGLAFSNAATGSFEAVVQVLISATTPLRQTFKIQGTQIASNWDITQSTNGNESGYVFTITSAGQIQYTSPNSTGFTSATVRFRAVTLPV